MTEYLRRIGIRLFPPGFAEIVDQLNVGFFRWSQLDNLARFGAVVQAGGGYGAESACREPCREQCSPAHRRCGIVHVVVSLVCPPAAFELSVGCSRTARKSIKIYVQATLATLVGIRHL